jgi:hypothetical protein
MKSLVRFTAVLTLVVAMSLPAAAQKVDMSTLGCADAL